MLDNRTGVAENDDLMRSAAYLILNYDWLMGHEDGVLLEDISDLVTALEESLKRIDTDWEAHYGK